MRFLLMLAFLFVGGVASAQEDSTLYGWFRGVKYDSAAQVNGIA